MFKGLFKFFSSLKLAVFSLLLLSAVLAFATIMGSYYGMRGSQILVYQRWWFAGVLFLLGLNVFCATLSRYPWKLRQTGFVLTHTGIIILLVGAFVTQKFGLDGNMPVPEGKQSNELILNDLKLTLRDQKNGRTLVFPVTESHRSREGKLLEIKLGNSETLVLEKFIPRAVPETKYVASPLSGVGMPALKIGLANNRFQVEEWLKVEPKTLKTELNLGPAIVTFEKLTSKEMEKDFFKKSPSIEAKPKSFDKGQILLEQKGQRFALKISDLIGTWRTIEAAGLEIQVKRYLPYAVVEDKKLISKSQEPINPAVEVFIRKIGESKEEKHTLFARFPEFNTRHSQKEKPEEKLNVVLQMQVAEEPTSLMGVGKSRGRLFLAQSADSQKLFYRSVSSSGTVNSEGELPVGKKIATGWMDIQLEAKEWLPSAVVDEEPRSVEMIEGKDEPFLTAIKVKVGQTPSFWLLEGMGKNLAVGESDILLQYHRDRVQLPFDLHLEKFTVGTNPGTSTAASFVSEVRVRDPKLNEEKKATISMNEPLKHGGYYFYQASYQTAPGQPAISVFAVNHDPGRVLKYLGSLVMTFGIGLMFYMNPHYLRILMGSHKEAS